MWEILSLMSLLQTAGGKLPPSQRSSLEMEIILEDRIKTYLNLSNSSQTPNCQSNLQIDFVSMVLIKTKYCKKVTCTCRGKLSTTHIVFNCHQLQIILQKLRTITPRSIRFQLTLYNNNPQCFVFVGPFIAEESNWSISLNCI